MASTMASQVEEPQRRGRPRDAEVDDRVFAATIDLLCEVGYADLTIAGIAKRSGVARTTLYRRWSSATEIICALVADVTPTEIERTGHTRADLERVMQTAIDSTSPFPMEAHIALMAAQFADPAIAASFDAVDLVHRRAVRDIVEKAIADGELRPDLDVELFTDQLGGIFAYRRLSHRPLPPNLATEAVRNLLEGVNA